MAAYHTDLIANYQFITLSTGCLPVERRYAPFFRSFITIFPAHFLDFLNCAVDVAGTGFKFHS